MNEQKKSDAAFEEEEACSKQTEDAELADQDVFAVDDDIREDDEGSRFNDSSGVDTTMLDMYSRAVSSAYWSVGNRCLAPFYEDNMWYPAMIQKLHWKSGECEVLYEGYGNVATVSITDLAAINEDTRAEGNTCATQLSSSNSADSDCPNGEDNRRTERSRKCEEFLQQWSVGNRCLAPFYEDNMWYPAMIQKLHWKSGECEVLYEGYGNVATVSITDLAAINEDTRAEGNTCATQLSSSNSADSDCPNGEDNRRTERSRKCEEFLQQGLHALPSMAPPPPPSFLNRAAAMDGEDVEANMLISWYMCGYHTGYRQCTFQVLAAKRRLNGETFPKPKRRRYNVFLIVYPCINLYKNGSPCRNGNRIQNELNPLIILNLLSAFFVAVVVNVSSYASTMKTDSRHNHMTRSCDP
ncbi:Survival of motor neuron protein [Toxocara canis]|uniref:Survival of motor neuron protein n=1 Tax=Toxocara canis TaxID=6265 RepID=A0A0B2W204_TOXCA|nr:Survival of motor neuron protein [Toxocara canis]